MNKKPLTLIPQPVKDFQCIGGACEDHCCSTWRIDVDKQTYFKYKSVKEPNLKKLLGEAIQRNRQGKTENQYARIKLNDKGQCSLLDENKLCMIHKELGESSLCYTCAVYPRSYKLIGEYVEKTLSLSCPEATRLLLQPEEGIEFIEQSFEAERGIYNGKYQSLNMNIFWPIRIFIIQLLQNRTIFLDDRIILLGLFIQKLANLENLTVENVEAEIHAFQIRLATPAYIQMVEQMPHNNIFKLQLAKELIKTHVESGHYNIRYIEVVNDFIIGLQTGDLAIPGVTQNTIDLYEKASEVFQEFMNKNSFMLENYLVHYVFSNVFPFQEKSLHLSYMQIVLNYMMIKLHLIGMAAQHGQLKKEDVIKCVQSYSKATAHSPTGLKAVEEKIKLANLDAFTYLLLIIKDK